MAVLYAVFAGLSGWLLSRRVGIVPRPLPALVISVVFLICPAQILGLFQIFGWAGRIGFGALLCIECALFGAAFLIVRRHPPLLDIQLPPTARVPVYLKVGSALLAATYLLLASDLLTSFPSGWDALAYHFPVSLRLLQEGTLTPVSMVWQLSLPANAEIGMALFLGTGYQSLAPLVNWLAVLVLGYSAYVIGMHIAGNRTAALGAVVVVLSIPIVQFQTFSGYVDLFGTSFLLAAVALFLESRSLYGLNPANSRDVLSASVLSGLACGISIGSKPTFYVFGGLFYLVAIIVAVCESRRRAQKFAQTILLITLFTAGIAAPSVFWFIRGVRFTKNPVYPLRVAIWNHVVFGGYPSGQITAPDFELEYVRSPHEWMIYPWTEWKRNRSFDLMPYGTNTGFGAMFATFVPLGLAFFAKELAFGRLGKSQAILFGVFFLLLITWSFALRREPRFGLSLWVFACCLSTPLLRLLGRLAARPFGVIFVCSLASTCLITSSRPALNILGRIRQGQFSRSSIYGYPPIIDRLPTGSRVLNYSQSYMNNFALAGAELGNRVIPYFALPEHEGGKLEIDPAFREKSLNEGVLQVYRPDYIIEQLDDWQEPAAPRVSGLSLMSDTVLDLGDEGKRNRWRIWQVLKKP